MLAASHRYDSSSDKVMVKGGWIIESTVVLYRRLSAQAKSP
jgi:hypothetical protein